MTKFPKNNAFINYRQMNELLAYVRKYYFVIFRKKRDDEPFNHFAYIEDLRIAFKVTLALGRKKITYITHKNEEEVSQKVTGVSAYKTLRQYCDIHVLENAKKMGSAVPLLYFNQKYNKTRQKAYAYDLNSAYSDAMTGLMPDTTKIVGECRHVKKGEIGFIEYNLGAEDIPLAKNNLIMVDTGDYADIIFKAMESPFKEFVGVWYNRKVKAKTKEQKLKAKGILNYSVGYLQLKNPYIRSTIVTRCNKRIQALMDKNTLYCNTDSLVSKVPRDDLIIGEGLGEWKQEHVGQFAYDGFNYQWDDDIPTYRGVPKSWFKKGWDILKDPLPESHNIVEFDKDSFQLRRVEEWQE